MRVVYEDIDKELKSIIAQKAKYQKVMLLHDDTVSNAQINKLYENVKELCVYNQVDISAIEESEIYNGYKALIYFCSTDSFLKIKFDVDEFVNIFNIIILYIMPK